MRAPIEWLKEFVEINISPEELAHRLTMAGLEVGAIEYHGKNISDVVAGKIKSIEKHATKGNVLICQVDTGAKILQVVTKAMNLKVGDKVPVALRGAKLPSGIKIERMELHGIESFGMLCSSVELGLTESAEGILILDKDTAVGEDIRKVLGVGGAVLDIDVLPNRIDVLSIYGVAREIAAVLNKKLKPIKIKVKEAGSGKYPGFEISVKDPKLCPRYMARIIRGVKIAPSPSWIEEKLVACGMRPVNNIVDATNYVLLEMGQPLHAFDMKSLAGSVIIVRKSKKGEKIITIDGEKRELGGQLVIADRDKPVAIAGVMGGKDTEVVDPTSDILLESAYFDPESIHKTEKELKLRTEASLRFDRGVDWEVVELALDRAAQFIAEIAGGKIENIKYDICEKPRLPKKIKLRIERVNSILGTKLKESAIKALLHRLGIELKGSIASVPLFRAGDIEREIDIVEEIARIYGYENIPITLPGIKVKSAEILAEKQILRIKDHLTDQGFNEVTTYSMLPGSGSEGLQLVKGAKVKILNPINDDLLYMRDSLLPSLLRTLIYNVNRQAENVNIFEVNKIFYKDEKGHIIEKLMLGAVLYGKRIYRYDGIKEGSDLFQIKTIVQDVLNILSVKHSFSQNILSGFHPGRSASIQKNKELLGVFGELHPDVCDKAGVAGPVHAFMIDLSGVLGVKKLPNIYKDIPLYPSIKRDIALIVPNGITHEAILNEIRSTGGSLVESIDLFDKYEGKQIEQGYYSLAYSIIYRRPDRTLTDDEVNSKHSEISHDLSQKLSVKVRG